MKTDAELVAHVAAGGKVEPGDVSPAYRELLTGLMSTFVDSILACAAGFAELINRAPGLPERIVTARIVAEQFTHAQRVLGLLEKFGVDPESHMRSHAWAARLERHIDLGNRRIGTDRRLNLFHYPLEGWIDGVTMNMLMGTASAVQLKELTDCSYRPLALAMRDIAPTEAQHARFGEAGLRHAVSLAGTTLPAQAAASYWYPRVAATFGRLESERFPMYRDFGLRRHTNAELLRRWDDDIRPRLRALGLNVP